MRIRNSSIILFLVLAAFALADGDTFAATSAPDSVLAAQQEQLTDPDQLPGQVRKLLYKVQILRSKDKPDEARRELRKHFAEKPDLDHALLRLQLGNLLALADSLDAAQEQLERAVELEPLLLPAWQNLGEVAYALGNSGRAAEGFARAYALDPEHDENLRYYQAVALLQDQQDASALNVMEDMLNDARGASPFNWYQVLVAAAVSAEQPDRASRWMDDLVKNHAEDPEAWYLAYQQAASSDRLEQAVSYLTITGYLRPLTRAESIQLGDLCMAVRAPARAVKYYAVIQEGGQTSGRDLDRLVSANLAAHDRAAALAVIDQRIAVEPTAQALSLKGNLLYEDGNFAGAYAAFDRAANLDANNSQLDLLRGYCLLEMGRNDEALRALGRAARDARWKDQANAARDHLLRNNP